MMFVNVAHVDAESHDACCNGKHWAILKVQVRTAQRLWNRLQHLHAHAPLINLRLCHLVLYCCTHSLPRGRVHLQTSEGC